jgi:GNAT superfamily N-acetyltransferase
MLSERTLSVVTSYWTSHLGLPAASLFAEPRQVITHGGERLRYQGIFALFRENSAIISFPPQYPKSIDLLLPMQFLTPNTLANSFASANFKVIGPAYIGYAEAVHSATHSPRSLTATDRDAVRTLQAACGKEEWSHGGSNISKQPASGLFIGSDLVSLAGYEVWGGFIAHIYAITHPAFRGRGFGRDVVAHLSNEALKTGLIPQYRTLESNEPAIRLAKSLGFVHFATSVAVRLSNENA